LKRNRDSIRRRITFSFCDLGYFSSPQSFRSATFGLRVIDGLYYHRACSRRTDIPMAAVEATTPNGFGTNDAPTPEDPEAQLNGDASDDADLFGDDDDEPVAAHKEQRNLDDKELDSGDDEGREDRVADTVEDYGVTEEQHETVMCDVDIARIRPPEGDELYALQLPPFLGLNQRNFHYPSYEPPTKPHDAGAMKAGGKFSAFSTAQSTVHWRRDPNPAKEGALQSNARIIRWSDGSLTLQLASKPTQQYRISTSALRQNYNVKTNKLSKSTMPYDPNRDTHNYLAAPHNTSGLDSQITRPLDAVLRIQPSGDLADESVNKLKDALFRASDIGDPLASIAKLKQDPEYQRLQAEKAEKEELRAIRRRENATQRMNQRREGVLGRSGVGGGRGGLSVAGLEDDEGMPSARGNRQKGGKRRPKTNRHGIIYSDNEDEDMPRGRTREDEYDRDDNFLADSDEEPETYEDDEELLDDDDDEDAEGEVDDEVAAAAPPQRRASTPKRAAEDDADDDAGAGRASPNQARKRRRVVDDDDDEDDE
jgi:RNA polymerase-associated protein LEO1